MYLGEPTLADIIRLVSKARRDEIEQYEALVGLWDIDTVTHQFWVRTGVKFALIEEENNIAVCVGGWEPVIDGVYQSWMVGTEDYWEKYWRSITKWSRTVMDKMMTELGARRLQTAAIASRTEAIEWYVRGLKMKPEVVLKNFGFNGEDMATFVRLQEKTDGQ